MFEKIFAKFKQPGPTLDRLIIDPEATMSENGKLIESFGVRIHDGSIAPFSKYGESYPTTGSYSFSTDEDHQDQITLEFHRSSKSVACKESFVGTVRIRGYELEPARKPMVRVYYELANDQIVIWVANEKNNGKLSLSLVKNYVGESVH